MSLLNDALKRAKLEALEREAANRGDYGLPTVRTPPRRRWAGIVAAVLGLVLLALVGAAIGWLAGRSDDREQAGGGQPAGVEATGVAPPPHQTAALEPDVEAEPVSTQPGSASSEQSQLPDRAGDNPVPVSPASDPRQAVEQEPAADADARPASGRLTDGASYVRVLDFDGGSLELQGIAFRGASSVAIINGLMVAPEDMVSGFLVIAIEPDRVQLQGRGVTVYLALHAMP